MYKKETETRFLEVDKISLVKRLRELQATDKGEYLLNEKIFYDKDLNWMNQNRFVRLRKRGDIIHFTYKNNKEQQIDSAREVEFDITDIDAAQVFLEAMGLIQYRVVEKKRHTFILDNVTIDIDTWPKIPVYVELEGDSVQDIQKVAEKLGFEWENRYDKDARYVFKKYGFDFDNIRTVTFDKFE